MYRGLCGVGSGIATDGGCVTVECDDGDGDDDDSLTVTHDDALKDKKSVTSSHSSSHQHL